MTVAVQQHDTDSPLLPIEHIERLNQINPDHVKWLLDQTQAEAEHRRVQESRINVFVFIERVGGLIFAAVTGLSGMVGGAYVVLHGSPWAGVSIATATIGTLAVAFIYGRKGKSPLPTTTEPVRSSKKSK
jgi:uncharacterized membrane protein